MMKNQIQDFAFVADLLQGENLFLGPHRYLWQSKTGASTWSGTRGPSRSTTTPCFMSCSASQICMSPCSSPSGSSHRRQLSSPSPSHGPRWSWRQSPPGWVCWSTWPPWWSQCGGLLSAAACRREADRSLRISGPLKKLPAYRQVTSSWWGGTKISEQIGKEKIPTISSLSHPWQSLTIRRQM